jgi:hypothetical protein
MGYLDFMKILSHTLLLGSEKELSDVPSSPASMESAPTASMQSPNVLPPKRVPAKDSPFLLDGKPKDYVLLKFPAARSDSSLIKR